MVEPLIDIGKLAEPATALVNKVSDAIGGLAKPWQIVRVAKAQAEADKIDAEAKLEISEIQQRTLRRWLAEEVRKQSNMESITTKALPELKENAQPKDVDDDWITNFFDKARLISDEQMQQLWARVLAGEANSPGKFSKRTVALLESLDKSEAESFASTCRFVVGRTLLIYDEQHAIYTNHGTNLGIFHHLADIGLVNYEPLTGFAMIFNDPHLIFRYFMKRIRVTVSQPLPIKFDVGKVHLTKSGSELASVCVAPEVPGFVDYLVSHWHEKNFAVEFIPAEDASEDS